MSWTGYAALPTGETINPQHLADSPYFFDEMVAYVLFKTSEARTRPTRVFTSSGYLTFDEATPDGRVVSRAMKVGDEIELYHDQDGTQLGEYRVCGISRADNGAEVGLVPDIKIKHCVAK